MLTFYFSDAPQYVATCSRGYASHLLRSYRKQKARYKLVRLGAGMYSIKNNYPGSPEGILRTR